MTSPPTDYPANWRPAAARGQSGAAPAEAVQMAIDSYIASLSDSEFIALVERTRGPLMPATSALADAQALVTAVESAGGRTPEPLMNILAGAGLLARHCAAADPAKGIVDAAGGRHPDRRTAGRSAHRSGAAAVGGELPR